MMAYADALRKKSFECSLSVEGSEYVRQQSPMIRDSLVSLVSSAVQGNHRVTST